jgi:hypothetical protein
MYVLMSVHSIPATEWFATHTSEVYGRSPSVCVDVFSQYSSDCMICYTITGIWMLTTMYGLYHFRWILWLNNLLHTSKANGHSPPCMHWCLFRTSLSLNDLLHTSQANGHSPTMYWCLFELLLWLNDLLHTTQANGHYKLCMCWCVSRCSPVCMHLCIFRLPLWLNGLLHTSETYGCSPVCMCLSSDHPSDCMICYTHHRHGRSPVCMHSCFFR